MTDNQTVNDVLAACETRRQQRRRFMKIAGGATAAAGGLSLLAACGGGDKDDPTPSPTASPTPTPTPTVAFTDAEVLNVALNLEYLEAQFYSYAAFGTGLPAASLTGTGAQGAVTGGRQVAFTDPLVAAYAREIAYDEIAHVNFLRSALGTAAVAQPALNIDGGATGAFTAAARAAGVIDANATFDPYASDESFLLGAFIFEDVGVTAYKGASILLTSATFLEAAAGILAAEAYHAGLVRTVLYAKGIDPANGLRVNAGKISDARDSLDGTVASATVPSADDDQGITIANDPSQSNIVPADGNAIAYSRNVGQVHNIVYLTNKKATSGGFFPAGTNNKYDLFRQSGDN